VSTPTARIAEVRYTRDDGVRVGRAAAVLALARRSALGALGARRSWRAKVIPVGLTLIAFAPAFVVLGLRALFAKRIDADLSRVLPYRDYLNGIGLTIMAFAAIVTPELLCPDRRDRVLSLYLSTAVSRVEYVAGKVLAAAGPLLLVTMLPMLFLYAGNVLFAEHAAGYLQHHLADLPRILGASLIVVVYFAATGLAFASTTSRRAFALGGFAASMVVSSVVAGIISHENASATWPQAFVLPAVPILLAQHLFPGVQPADELSGSGLALSYAVIVSVSTAVIWLRYRRAE
jgi:hypothetical protein